MIFPTIHLNGTSAGSLKDGYEKAEIALMSALEALAEASPNARDYYVQSPGAHGTASDEHDARMNRVRQTLEEVRALSVSVYTQNEQRTR